MSGKYDTDAIKASVNIANVIGSYVSLKQDGKEFKGCCPFHNEKTPSFFVVPEKGFYKCFGCGEHGDVIDFITSHTGVSFQEACDALGGEKLPEGKPFAPRPAAERDNPYKNYKPEKTKKKIKVGVPIDLVNPKRDGKVWEGAKPLAVHAYYTLDGDLLGYVLRLEIKGEKITPQVRYTDKGWTFYPFDEPRPLYGLYTLLKNKDRQCLIVEGEKAADAARRIAGDKMNVVSWCGGTNGVSRTDWKPLNGRKIVIIPDRDNAGLKACREILSRIKPAEIKHVLPPADLPKGWDVADYNWSHDGEFFEWCKKHSVKKLPEKYDNEKTESKKEPKPKEEKTPQELKPMHANEHDLSHQLQGKHSIDSNILAMALKNKMLYDEYLKQWFKFDKVWREVPEAVVRKFLITAMDSQFSEGYQVSKFTGTYNMLQMRLAVVSEDINGVKPDNWMTEKHLLPMQNGVLDLNTKELIPHSPELLMNWCLPHEWKPGSKYDVITKFLRSLSGENNSTHETLLCFLAAVLRGMSKSQKFLEIIGTPGTGKSTFIKLACELVGEANLTTTSMDQLQNNNFETANLYGKRLAIITDADKYGGSVEVFKAATGQDPLRFERKNQQQGQSFIYQGMIIVAANQPVQYKDQSTAMMRRRIPVHIDHRLDEKERDPDLSEKMSKEIPGLIQDLVGMPEDYIESVLNDEKSKRTESRNRSLVETNVIAEWLNDCVVAFEECEVKIGDAKRDGTKVLNSDEWLYPNYVVWADSTGRKSQVALNTFRKTVCEILQTIGIKVKAHRTANGTYIKGIRLRLDTDFREPSIITGEELVK